MSPGLRIKGHASRKRAASLKYLAGCECGLDAPIYLLESETREWHREHKADVGCRNDLKALGVLPHDEPTSTDPPAGGDNKGEAELQLLLLENEVVELRQSVIDHQARLITLEDYMRQAAQELDKMAYQVIGRERSRLEGKAEGARMCAEYVNRLVRSKAWAISTTQGSLEN